jgi:Na+/H+ antiporter NhaD/arsenite permease-like protein
MAFAIAVFAASLAAIASERFDRTKVALVGAVLMLLTQTIDQDHAIASIDFKRFGFLPGLFPLLRLPKTTGWSTWPAFARAQLPPGTPLPSVN